MYKLVEDLVWCRVEATTGKVNVGVKFNLKSYNKMVI